MYTTADKQQIFDIVAAHLLKQGKLSADDRGNCMYRGPQGTMCAIGVLIPDDVYNPAFEGKSAWYLITRGPLHDLFDAELTPFLDSLQTIHDYNTSAEWPGALAQFATDHSLTFQDHTNALL